MCLFVYICMLATVGGCDASIGLRQTSSKSKVFEWSRSPGKIRIAHQNQQSTFNEMRHTRCTPHHTTQYTHHFHNSHRGSVTRGNRVGRRKRNRQTEGMCCFIWLKSFKGHWLKWVISNLTNRLELVWVQRMYVKSDALKLFDVRKKWVKFFFKRFSSKLLLKRVWLFRLYYRFIQPAT